jgi:lipoprotein-releasing system ATP-binding protein
MSSANPFLQAYSIRKTFQQGASTLDILRGIDLEVEQGDAVCIMGPSGAGKSTLLHILGTLDKPTLGRIYFKGEEITSWSDQKISQFRNEKMGFVFQFHFLLAELNALENICLPLLIAGEPKAKATIQAEELLEMMGLTERKNHFPSELSGGERSRVAIARAIVRRPEILLADEPTGNLDTENDHKVQQIFFDLRKRFNLTLLAVTHDERFASRFPRVLRLKDGQWA